MPPTIKAQQIYAYQNDVDGIRTLLATASDGTGVSSIANTVAYWDANGVTQTIFTPSVLAKTVRAVFSRDYMYFTDNVAADLKKWNYNGLTFTNWGIAGPVSAPVLSTPSPGAITLLTGRIYYVVFLNSTSQDYSDISPQSAITGALTNQEQPLIDLPVSSDPQVDQKVILATADGGDPSTLYFVAQVPNATTTYTDNTTEVNLLEANVYQYTDSSGVDHGVVDNTPPPNGSYPIKSNGRIFLAAGQTLFFSKSLAEVLTSTGIIAGRYEDCWPVSNSIDISENAEQIRGLLTDGQTLYIGTELHIRRLTGDGPSNFSQPQVIFNNTGLLTQNVWQVIYVEGTPVGTMWLTPDLRVMKSDFNTYDNVGTPVQPILNTINQSALDSAWAISVSIGPYNFYVLGIPTGTNTVADTFLIFDLRLGKWYVWEMADMFACGIYYVNIAGVARWIMIDSSGTVRTFDQSFLMDRVGDTGTTPITSTIQTTWLDLGDPYLHKALNELEIVTSDPNIEVTIQGASRASEFASPPVTLISDQNPTLSPFGDYKLYLAGTRAINHYYQVTLESVTSNTSEESDTLLGVYRFEVLPIHRM